MKDDIRMRADEHRPDTPENGSPIVFSDSVYREIVESSHDLIWQCDIEGRYVFLNRAWEKAFGYDLEEMLGRRFVEFMSPEQAEKDMAVFLTLTEGESIRDYETCHLHKLGRPVWLSFNADYVRGESGEKTAS